MFAYCLNNPINRIDPTGSASIWYYLIVDSDMGFVHRAVQAHIGLTYGVQTEVSLSTFGRADILHGGAVWEIKHSGTSPDLRTISAYSQAMNYVLLNAEVTQLGSAGAYSGSFYIGCLDYSYLVEYKTPARGVVLYTVTEVDNYNGAYAFVYVPKEAKNDIKKAGTAIAVIGAGALCGLAFGGVSNSSRDFSYNFAAIG